MKKSWIAVNLEPKIGTVPLKFNVEQLEGMVHIILFHVNAALPSHNALTGASSYNYSYMFTSKVFVLQITNTQPSKSLLCASHALS